MGNSRVSAVLPPLAVLVGALLLIFSGFCAAVAVEAAPAPSLDGGADVSWPMLLSMVFGGLALWLKKRAPALHFFRTAWGALTLTVASAAASAAAHALLIHGFTRVTLYSAAVGFVTALLGVIDTGPQPAAQSVPVGTVVQGDKK
jgi:hypothetical protein